MSDPGISYCIHHGVYHIHGCAEFEEFHKTSNQEWDRIVANTDPTHHEPKKPDQLRQAAAGLISTITVCGGITWGLWTIHIVAGWFG